MLETNLEDERIGMHFNNYEALDEVVHTIENTLSEYDKITVNRTAFVNRSRQNKPDQIKYDCRLEVVFDLVEEDTVLTDEEIVGNIRSELEINGSQVF